MAEKYGRTLNMLKQAGEAARAGERVIVVAYHANQASQLRKWFHDTLKPIQNDRVRVIRFDDRLSGLRVDKVYIDHYVIEMAIHAADGRVDKMSDDALRRGESLYSEWTRFMYLHGCRETHEGILLAGRADRFGRELDRRAKLKEEEKKRGDAHTAVR